MVLHFNLKSVAFICLCLILWQALLSYTFLGGAVFFAVCLWCLKHKKEEIVVDGIFAASFLLNLWYVLSSWGNVRQYDYFNFFMHADYFVANDFFIFKPSDYLQSVYFQPPLWGFISGVITKIIMLLGKVEESGFDFVRFISLFAISGAGIIFWRLCQKFQFKDKLKLWLFTAFVFMPINGIMANLVNNDAMVYFLMTALIYVAVLWYDDSSWKNSFIIGGLLLIATMIKFSALMMLPALGILGFLKLLTVKKTAYPKICGEGLIMIVGAVLGFAWGGFLLYHHLPLTPPPLNNEFQNMEGFRLTERLFSLAQASFPFADVRLKQLEPNVWLTLIKTSLFGEWTWQGLIWAYILYGFGILSAILFVMSFFSLLTRPFGKDYAFNAFLIVLIFSVLTAWINFWLDYPYFCSAEFRYTIILMPAAFLWLGHFITQKHLPKAIDYTLAGAVVLMIFARFMLYLNTI